MVATSVGVLAKDNQMTFRDAACLHGNSMTDHVRGDQASVDRRTGEAVEPLHLCRLRPHERPLSRGHTRWTTGPISLVRSAVTKDSVLWFW
jgi:hypothetical protein